MSREFNDATKQELEAICSRYPKREAALLPALRLLEREFGCVDEDGYNTIHPRPKRVKPEPYVRVERDGRGWIVRRGDGGWITWQSEHFMFKWVAERVARKWRAEQAAAGGAE